MSPSPSSYLQHVGDLERRLNADQALKVAIGGEFIAMGRLEFHLLQSRGLRDDDLVIDVGCGSGRLACQLARLPKLRYIGCDVVPRLLEYATSLCQRPDWQFLPTTGARIPCGDDLADMVCFFSVFTHLPQEDIFRYFREAQRVLKPGGLMILSFLEFGTASHWKTFIASVDHTRDDTHLNQFIEREAIRAWAAHAGFEVCGVHGGDTSYIPLPEEIRLENGDRMKDAGSLGQSVAVLRKLAPSPAASLPPSASPSVLSAAPAAERAAPGPLRNVSSRGKVAAGETMITGFIVGGEATRRVLVRALGPTLRIFGVHDPMPQPRLELRCGETLLSPDPTPAASVAGVTAAIGAPALFAGGNEPAHLFSLPPGGYTALAGPAPGSKGGDVLVEVFAVD